MTNYQQWIDAAARLSQRLHAGQIDKAGMPYFEGHLRLVAAQGRTWLEQIVGYLHDAAEDTPYTVSEVLELLEAEAKNQLPYTTKLELSHALNLLTHQEGATRKQYIEAIATSPLATAVKLHDLQHNMVLSRLASPTEQDLDRNTRYKAEYEYLLIKDTKPILYIDMDNVLVNFESGIARLDDATKVEYQGRLDEVPGIFSLMEPMDGAVEAVVRLQEVYDVYVLSTAPWLNPSAWSDKLLWIQHYFGLDKDTPLYKRLILSHHKHLNQGAIIIDDRTKNGIESFSGQHLHFGTEACPNWNSVLHLLNIK